jgi:hypothetical protein
MKKIDREEAHRPILTISVPFILSIRLSASVHTHNFGGEKVSIHDSVEREDDY